MNVRSMINIANGIETNDLYFEDYDRYQYLNNLSMTTIEELRKINIILMNPNYDLVNVTLYEISL